MSILWDRDEDFKDGKTVAGQHPGGTQGSLGNKRGKHMTSGFHHIALVVKDMDQVRALPQAARERNPLSIRSFPVLLRNTKRRCA